MLGKPRILSLSPTRLINSIKHEYSCKILYIQPLDRTTAAMHMFHISVQFLKIWQQKELSHACIQCCFFLFYLNVHWGDHYLLKAQKVCDAYQESSPPTAISSLRRSLPCKEVTWLQYSFVERTRYCGQVTSFMVSSAHLFSSLLK